MGLARRVGKLEERLHPDLLDPETHLREVLRRMTDEELEAYAAALDNAPDEQVRFPYTGGPIGRRVEELWEETANGRSA